MYVQLILEVISSLFKNEKRPSNFHEFWSEELYYEKIQNNNKKSCLNVITLWIP
jgi:hypothetical protein